MKMKRTVLLFIFVMVFSSYVFAENARSFGYSEGPSSIYTGPSEKKKLGTEHQPGTKKTVRRKSAVETYILATRSKDPKVREMACRQLRQYRDKRAIAALTNELNDARKPVRKAAYASLVAVGHLAESSLTGKLSHRNPAVRAKAERLLGRLHTNDTGRQQAKVLPKAPVYGDKTLSGQKQVAKKGTAAENITNTNGQSTEIAKVSK